MIMPAPVPMTVIGGFLGAGKTTLLNHLLRDNHGVRFAIMVNDFGDLMIDDQLLAAHDGDTLTFANGCVCCTLGDNFMRSLATVLDARRPPQQILVEASGVADPRSIADIAALHPKLRRDLVLVLAAADTVRERAADELTGDTAQRQLAAADLIVLNTTDLVDAKQRRALRRWLAGYTDAAVIETQQARLPLSVLTPGARPLVHPPPVNELRSGPSVYHHHHHHDTFSAVSVAADAPFDLQRLRRLLATLPRSVLRGKGFLRAAAPDNGDYLLQLSGRQIDLRRQKAGCRPGLVFIGTREMPAAEQLAQRLAAAQLGGAAG